MATAEKITDTAVRESMLAAAEQISDVEGATRHESIKLQRLIRKTDRDLVNRLVDELGLDTGQIDRVFVCSCVAVVLRKIRFEKGWVK